MVKRIMEEFTIGEISAVDNPAQQGAKMKIIKRAEGQEMEQFVGIAKRYIDPIAGAVSFGTVMMEEMRCREYYEMMEHVGPLINAMETSLRSIAGDSTVPDDTKLTMARNTVEDFMTTLRSKWNEADMVMMSAVSKLNEKEDEDMTKKVTDLEAQIAELTKQLEVAKAASGDSNVAAELTTQVETLKATVADLTEKLEDATSKAAMSSEEKEYMRTLGKEEQKKFRTMAAKDRKAAMSKAAEGDETLTLKGKTVRKSVVGEDVFEIMKAQAEEHEETKKGLEDERQRRITVELTRTAKENYGHLPGTDAEKAEVLKAIETLPEAVQGSIVKMFVAGEGAIKSAFARVGAGGDDDSVRRARKNSTEQHPFMTKVAEIRKRDDIGHASAMTKARKEFPKEFADFQGVDAAE